MPEYLLDQVEYAKAKKLLESGKWACIRGWEIRPMGVHGLFVIATRFDDNTIISGKISTILRIIYMITKEN